MEAAGFAYITEFTPGKAKSKEDTLSKYNATAYLQGSADHMPQHSASTTWLTHCYETLSRVPGTPTRERPKFGLSFYICKISNEDRFTVNLAKYNPS